MALYILPAKNSGEMDKLSEELSDKKFKLLEKEDNYILMKKRRYGNILIHIVCLIIALQFIGIVIFVNVVYFSYSFLWASPNVLITTETVGEDGQPLEFSDSNGNSTIGRKKTITDAYLRYGDSRGLTYKTLGREYDCGICKKDIVDNAEFLERGQVRLNTESEYKWDSTIKLLQRQPYPARIESITLGLNFNDKS